METVPPKLINGEEVGIIVMLAETPTKAKHGKRSANVEKVSKVIWEGCYGG